MNINPMKLLKLKEFWGQFSSRHPKFPGFIKAVASGNVLNSGTIIEVSITTADGRNYTSNIKLTPEDIELIEELKGLKD